MPHTWHAKNDDKTNGNTRRIRTTERLRTHRRGYRRRLMDIELRHVYRRILQSPVRLRFIIHRRFLFGFRGDAPAPLPRYGLGRHHFIPPRNALQHAHLLLRRPVDGRGAVHILPVHRPRFHAFTIRGNHQHTRIQDDAVGLWHETGRHEAGNGQHRSAAPY